MDRQRKIILISGASLIVLLFLTRKPITKFVKRTLTDPDKKKFLALITPEVYRLAKSIGVPPLFMIAQISLETGFGNSELFTKYYNVGGVKAIKGAPYVTYQTTECKGGVCKKVPQNFAKYPNLTAGLLAHSKVLTNRYFKQHTNKFTDPIQYAKALQSGQIKYATSPNYVNNIGNFLKEINRLTT